MDDATREFADLLAREREAVLRADLDELSELQEQKREVLDVAIASGVARQPAFLALVNVARANVVLIRQLVTVHRALAGLEPAKYGADGRQAHAAPPPTQRGVL